MTSGPRGSWRRGAALVCCLVAFVLLGVRQARAGISGTLHDFSLNGPYSTTLGQNGSCSACHIPHSGQPEAIWSRALDVAASDEKKYFNQVSNPNYAPGLTLLCYDCHDNHAITGAVDNDPPDASFDSSRLPQDVAFDDDMKTTVPRDGSDSDNKPGYYENIPSGTTGYPNTGGGASSYVSGHYVKNNPGVGGISQGDKLPCADCHDPHSAVNQAFIRSNLAGKTLTGMKASTRMAYDLSSRDDDLSRDICIACHGTSEQATYTAVRFNDVNPAYGSATIAAPTTRISAHAASKTTACTSCHLHNGMSVSCSDCHGFPPLRTYAQAGNNFFNKVSYPDVENYLGGAGAHQRHMDALGVAIFKCEICHGQDPGSAPWHNFGGGVFPGVNPGQNVDIMGESAYWDPDNSRSAARYTGIASTVSPPPAGYEFTARGGGNQRCANFACHGDPPDNLGDLTWTADMVDGDTLASAWENPNAGDLRICKWCHDATPAAINFGSGLYSAPNVMGTGGSRAAAANFGAEVNGHGLSPAARYDRNAVAEAAPVGANGAGKECTVCHDATYYDNPAAPPAPTNIPVKAHFDSSYGSAEKRLWSGASHQVNGVTISATAAAAPNELCVACHQNTGAAAGTQLSHHGNDATGGYVPLETPFTRVCRQCHDVHGANWNGAGRNLYMIGKWLDTDRDGTGDAGEGAYVDSLATGATVNITAADNAVVFTSRTGADSFDELDTVGTQDADDICATCHAPGTAGGDHSGTTSTFEMRGQDCTQCHDHDFDDVPATADAFMPSGCEGCHGQGGVVHLGINGGAGDDAPNVMTYWDGSWWDTNRGGSGTKQQGGHGDPDNLAARQCLDCHDIALPSSPRTHLDGTYNSIWGDSTGTRNENTAHLKASFIGAAAPAWSVQLTLDSACWGCHSTTGGIVDMRHERDGVPAAGVVQFGTHLSRSNGDTLPLPVPNPFSWAGPYPVDQDISTNASGSTYYAPCISCHDPHGTGAPAKTGGPNSTNFMLRDNWHAPSVLCKVCHP